MPKGLSLSDFDAVLFDVDGTLVDSMEMIVRGLGDVFERFKGRRPDRGEILALIGLPLRKQLRLYSDVEPTTEQIDEMVAFTLARFDELAEFESTFPAAIEALKLCHKQGLKTALVTSKCGVELSGFMKRFEGAHYVDATVCSTDVNHPKPNPESALLACERLGVSPSRTVMIGDSIYDLRCARGAGVAAIAVAYGAAERDALLAEKPDAMFEAPEDLLAWTQTAFLVTPCPARS